MDLVTFWKNYGMELEHILGRAHTAESRRLSDIILNGNHYAIREEKYAFEDFAMLRMIQTVVINMNRDEKIDSQKPITEPKD